MVNCLKKKKKSVHDFFFFFFPNQGHKESLGKTYRYWHIRIGKGEQTEV